MDKVKLELKVLKNKTIEYNNTDIEVTPFMSLSMQIFLIQKYIDDYFGTPDDILIENSKYHYIEAELKIKNIIFQLNTNIDINDFDNDIYSDVELWNKITNEIKNYNDFRDTLEIIISDIKQQEILENSIGKVVSELIQKGYALLDKLNNLNPEEIKKMGEEGQKLIERLEKSSILNNPQDKIAIVDDYNKKPIETKTRKPRKKKVE